MFCNQKAIANTQKIPSADEISETVCKGAESKNLIKSESEIAFFGGSFTALPESEMESYLKEASALVKKFGLKGIRISTRPDAIDESKLSLLKKYGVTAIELGAQSFSNEVLRKSKRGHTKEDIEAAAKLIKKEGFELILQLMTGLPGDTQGGAENSLAEAVSLNPDGLRIYPCIVITGSELAQMYERGEYAPQSLSEAVGLCKKLVRAAGDLPVLKLGLHASESLFEKDYIAGPYHPAFSELVYGAVFLDEILEKAAGRQEVSVICNPKDRSMVVGHGGENARKIKMKITEDEKQPRGKIKIY